VMRALFVLSLLLVAPSLAAQDVPPEGELPSGHPPVEAPPEPMPEGHPPVDAAPAGEPTPGHPPMGAPGGMGMGGMGDAAIARMFAPPEVATAEPASDVPVGSIRVVVVDEHDAPVADAEIELGVMRSAGDRDRLPARSGADGTYVYEGLETGGSQAYRVNVLYEGATYSSTPFQLPPDTGYTTRVRRLPVSHDDEQVLQFVAQLLLEIRDDRLHVIVQTQLVNIGDATYVFPGDGTRVRLPEGFLAFQSQALMTDQHVEEQADYGVRIRGSLPPGSVTLAYAFDVPIDGDEATLRFGNPFRTMRFRVISEAPDGLSMEVEDFPRTRRVESEGQILLATELQRRPGDEPLEEIHVSLRGIPGPGPLRWIVLALALVLVVGGAARLARGGDPSATARAHLAALLRRKEELLAAAGEPDGEDEPDEGSEDDAKNYRDAPGVGRQKVSEAIVLEMAALLHREDRLRATLDASAASIPAKVREKIEMKERSRLGPEARKKSKKSAGGGARDGASR
jgi:hypothetical protein